MGVGRPLPLLRRETVARGLSHLTWGFVLALLLWLVALSSFTSPVFGAFLTVVVLLTGIAALFYRSLPTIYLGLLGLSLGGYAFFGRGFAYLGFPPLFIGEIVLTLGVAVLVVHGRVTSALRSPVALLVVAFMVLGAIATAPYIATHQLNALRDAALWAYAIFALLVFGLVRDRSMLWHALRRFSAVMPYFLVAAPIIFIVLALFEVLVPYTPFSTVRILGFKAGDVAVHLAGIMTFLVLGLHRAFGRPTRTGTWSREWFLWLLWIVALVTTLTSRSSIIIVGFVAILLMVVRPAQGWARLATVAVVLVAAFIALDVEITLGRGEQRPISPAGLYTIAQSIFEPVGDGALDGTRGWRLQWWGDIVGYTLFGEYFWTGKGYGRNLATEDGYQVYADESLRSPHNGHLTVLARSGVPGAVTWLLLNAAFVVALFRAYRRRRAEGRDLWARVNLWLLAYWFAFMINAGFDVYLEGPQGGIWFWSVVGFALAALRLQDAPDAGRPAEGVVQR